MKRYVEVHVNDDGNIYYKKGTECLIDMPKLTLADILKADEGLRERVAKELYRMNGHVGWEKFIHEVYFQRADTLIALIAKGE